MQARTATMALSSKKTYPMSPIFRGFPFHMRVLPTVKICYTLKVVNHS
jgi:hypothetical protein